MLDNGSVGQVGVVQLAEFAEDFDLAGEERAEEGGFGALHHFQGGALGGEVANAAALEKCRHNHQCPS